MFPEFSQLQIICQVSYQAARAAWPNEVSEMAPDAPTQVMQT